MMSSVGVLLGSSSSSSLLLSNGCDSSSGMRTMMRTRLCWGRVKGWSRVSCPVLVRVAVVSIAFIVVAMKGKKSS